MAISEQALHQVRRRKKARRLFKKMPLFAYQEVNRTVEKPYTSQVEFWHDLPIKTKPRREKSKKSPLVRYGRYAEMNRLIDLYDVTGEVEHLVQAQKLRKYMTHPYRIAVQYKGSTKIVTYSFPPETSYNEIVRLAALAKQCKSFEEFDARQDEAKKYISIGK